MNKGTAKTLALALLAIILALAAAPIVVALGQKLWSLIQ